MAFKMYSNQARHKSNLLVIPSVKPGFRSDRFLSKSLSQLHYQYETKNNEKSTHFDFGIHFTNLNENCTSHEVL